MDDRLQHKTRTEKILDLLADDFVEILSLIEKGREDENFQSRVVGFADGGDGLEELIHAQQGKRAGIGGNDYRVIRVLIGVFGMECYGLGAL